MKNKNQIIAFSILASGKCNLNCKYCFLHKNKSLSAIDNLIQESWENGSYITNIQNTLTKLHVNFKDIKYITIWGGEPLLNLTNFNNSIIKLFDIFPNIQSFWTSTNFNINISELIHLLTNIDKSANNNVKFKLQLSIDGTYYKDGHNIPIEVYKKQLKDFIEQTLNINFKKIKIEINFRPTISEEDFLNLFFNEEQLNNYILYMLSLVDYINSFAINKNISFINNILPTAAYPSKSTTLDGIKFTEALQIWDQIKNKYDLTESLSDNGVGRMIDYNLFKNNYECRNLLQDITILPDGSITCCVNSFLNNFDLYINELKEQNDIEGQYKVLTEKPYSFNPLTMSDEEINKKLFLIQHVIKNNSSTYTYFALKMCEELLQVNQISNNYNHNKDLLLKHITLIGANLGCMFYNLHETQLPYLNSPSTFRKYLNGVAEYIETQKKNNAIRMEDNKNEL